MSDLLSKFLDLITSSAWTASWTIIATFAVIAFYINYKALTSHKERPESFAMIVACLKEDKFGSIYRRFLGIVLDKLADWLGDKSALKPLYKPDMQEGRPQLQAFNSYFSSNPFTAPSYEVLVRLAFIYPILAFLVVWAMGADGSVAGIDWLDESFSEAPIDIRWKLIVFGFVLPVIITLWLKRQRFKIQAIVLGFSTLIAILADFGEDVFLFWLVFLLLFLPMYCLSWTVAWLWLKDRYKAHQLIYSLAFANALAFSAAFVFVDVDVFSLSVAFLFAVVTTFVIASVSVLSIAVMGTFVSTFVVGLKVPDLFTVMVAFVFVFSGVVFVIHAWLKTMNRYEKHEAWFWLFYSLSFVTLAVFLVLSKEGQPDLVYLLFFLLFPLLNSPIDWLSLGVTRGLLQSIRHEHHGGWVAFAWALVDVVLAFSFLLLVSAVLVIAMGLVDGSMLHTVLAEIKQGMMAPVNSGQVETVKNYPWIYAMLLTTLIPTLLHFVLAASALTLWLPQKWRHHIANNLQHNHYKILAASTYLTITPFIGVLAPMLLLYGLYQVLIAHGGWLAKVLLSWAVMLARMF